MYTKHERNKSVNFNWIKAKYCLVTVTKQKFGVLESDGSHNRQFGELVEICHGAFGMEEGAIGLAHNALLYNGWLDGSV